MIIHDILYETHREYFSKGFGLQFRLMTRLCAPRAAAIITISEATKASLQRCYGVAPDKVHICPPGSLGLQEARPVVGPSVMKYQPYLLFVGRLEPRKNITTLIDAFEQLKRPELKLVIIGHEDFHFRDILERIAGNLAITHLRGISDEELQEFYANAEVFVFPTFAEGFGIPVLEAMCHRTPVVSSNTTSLPEAGGDLVRYFNPEGEGALVELVRQIEATLEGGGSYESHALATHLEKFTWEKTAQRVISIYND